MRNNIIIAALIFASVTVAQAGEIRFTDLNRDSPQGSAILKARIATAAALACGPVQVDFGVSAARLYEAGRERKSCIARVSERTFGAILALTAHL